MYFHGTNTNWDTLEKRIYQGHSDKVSLFHHHKLYKLICKIYSKAHITAPDEIRIVHGNTIDAETISDDKTFSKLFITSKALDAYNYSQLAGMIGHEVGHFVYTHQPTYDPFTEDLHPKLTEYEADKFGAKLTSYSDVISALKYFLPFDKDSKDSQSHSDYLTYKKSDQDHPSDISRIKLLKKEANTPSDSLHDAKNIIYQEYLQDKTEKSGSLIKSISYRSKAIPEQKDVLNKDDVEADQVKYNTKSIQRMLKQNKKLLLEMKHRRQAKQPSTKSQNDILMTSIKQQIKEHKQHQHKYNKNV